MDTLTKERRSEVMGLVKSKNTRPELRVRRLLHRMGIRFRLHGNLPGRPDLVLPKWNTVVLIHGCFWHRHEGCQNTRTPKSRVEFWTNKFDKNVKRDAEVKRILEGDGWNVFVIWECELDDPEELTRRIREFLRAASNEIS